MPKKKAHQTAKKYYPFVSVCTPTFNRRPFIQTMFQCFRNQTYPKDRVEWIIVDDGTDKISDLIKSSGISNIKYYEVDKKLTLGAKRNLMHSYCKGSILVYMDDDDYYPPDRIEHAVERLMSNPTALCAGSSEIYIYFKHIQQMVQFGPYNPNHATAGTFAFKAELLKTSRYNDAAALAEEREFLKGYTVPFVQLDPMKTILVFSHEHNTFDKRNLLTAGYNEVMKPSAKTVNDFIKFEKENDIKKFFMEDIDGLLAKYEPGEPKMKPDVLKQFNEIMEERKQELLKEQEANAKIMVNEPGKPPRELTNKEIIGLIQSQSADIQAKVARIAELEEKVANLEKMVFNTMSLSHTPINHTNIPVGQSKSDPVITLADLIKK